MQYGIRFETRNDELAIVKNNDIVIPAESLYSIVFDLLTVNCFLPEDWPPIRQKFDRTRNRYVISIGAENDSQVPKEIIENEEYINGLREGEYFLEGVIDPGKFINILRNKLTFMGLTEKEDFIIDYNRRFGRISLVFTGGREESFPADC